MSDRAGSRRSDPSSSSNRNNDSRVLLQANHEAVRDFGESVGLLWCSSPADGIEILDGPPAALRLLRDFVAASRPCIIRHAVPAVNNHDDAAAATPFLCLTLDALVEQHPDLALTVDATPDGHGDCLRQVLALHDNNHNKTEAEPVFVQPEERTMTLAGFCRGLRACSSSSLHSNGKAPVSPKEIRERIFFGITNSDIGKDTNLHDSTKDEAAEDEPEEGPAVLYYSRQNDCLRRELGPLWECLLRDHHLPTAFSWAEQAFGTGPADAVNLWMGNERAVSSMHKDHYENLFYVAAGEKVFTLCPPADAPFLYERPVPSGRFVSSEGVPVSKNGVGGGGSTSWKVRPDCSNKPERDEPRHPQRVPWIAADVTQLWNDGGGAGNQYLREFPLLRYAHPRTIRVRAGELLYLPALWFHRVTQSCETIGINYWYDMKFEGPSWCYFHLLQQLVPVIAVQDEEETECNNDD